MRIKVGEIQGCDVLYLPEKDILFCKNTAVPFNIIAAKLSSSNYRESIEDKKLTIIKEDGLITLGCLSTTKENINKIRKKVLFIKYEYNKHTEH